MFTRSRRLVPAVFFAVALAACYDVPSEPEAMPTGGTAVEQQTDRGARVIPDRYVVVFKDGVHDAPGLARRLAAEHGGTVHHTYQHAIKGFAATLPAPAVEALKRNPAVAYVEADQVTELAQSGATWGLDRVDQRYLPLSGSYAAQGNGAGVTVYVIDSGIETTHWDFGGRASVGYDAFDGNGQDCNGHGTHVAGTIGGATYGVARAVSLVAVRVRGCADGYASHLIAGVDWVRAHHASPAVANISVIVEGGSQALDAAVAALVESGVTVAAGAGNRGTDACYETPGRLAQVLTVGATDQNDAQAIWPADNRASNHGPCVDLYAPGTAITSAGLNGHISTRNGTSMAAAHVAGAAALYLQANPQASPSMVGNAMVTNATTNRLSGLGPNSPNRLLYVRAENFSILPPDVNSSHSPSTVLVDGITFAFYKGMDADPGIYMTRTTEAPERGAWTPTVRLPNDINTSEAPSAVAIGSTIYVVYKGSGPDLGVWMAQSSNHGLTWTTQLLSSHVNSNTRPEALVYGSSLHVVYKGILPEDRIYAVSTPVAGNPPFIVLPPDVSTSASPSALQVNSATFVFYKGLANDAAIYMTRNAGPPSQQTYVPNRRLPAAVNTSAAPSTAMVGDTMYVAYKGSGGDTRVYVVRTGDQGQSWSMTQLPADVNTSTRPQAFVRGNSLYVFYRGAGSDQRVYSVPVPGNAAWWPI